MGFADDAIGFADDHLVPRATTAADGTQALRGARRDTLS